MKNQLKKSSLKIRLMGGVAISVFASANALAAKFDIPRGYLATALDDFQAQSGISIIVAANEVKSVKSAGVKGDLPADAALSRILKGTGFIASPGLSGAVEIVPQHKKTSEAAESPIKVAAAAPRAPVQGAVETVVVTAQHKSENIQNVPIAVTALSQAQLTERQIAGGPDLVKEVPNLTFSKTNFTGYNLEIRGIGTQAISVTTDPAVAVAFNGTPFIRNHFFEQEFYDLSDVEVLRGPQGTLWGRNATAGVVNIVSAKPNDEFDMVASADFGNFNNRRFEGMINIPLVGDKLDLRMAGEWTKRDGYSFNELTNSPIDGRDLWSTRVTLGLHPTSALQATFVWEHFSENDDRMRTAKQLCKTAPTPTSIDGVSLPAPTYDVVENYKLTAAYMSQGCEAASLYSPDSFEVPNGFSLPYLTALGVASLVNSHIDPYASAVQSQNLRVIESALNPHYRANNDTLELNADYVITPALTFTSQTGYNQDFLWSTEDYNRFNTTPGIFLYPGSEPPGHAGLYPDPSGLAFCGDNGCTGGLAPGAPCTFVAGNINGCQQAAVFCDPQLGCSDRIVGEDLSDERAWQLSQEFRLTSNFSGPFNFSVGGNYLHYETEENYYVFINALSAYSKDGFGGDEGINGNTSDNSDCFHVSHFMGGWQNLNPRLGGGEPSQYCLYVDPNPITSLNNEGHNYFLSQNPYVLNSYAGFGEVYYNIASDLKLTGGLRWTEDRKHFIDIPSEVITQGYGYPVTGIVDQRWGELTGRAAANWTPKLDFTDQTLVYGSYAHGYKAGGANPPGAEFPEVGGSDIPFPIHPLTFKPEFINAYELGTKNTLLDDSLTLNGDIFYYDYKSYQISEIVDRTSINLNFDAKVHGAELETSWEPAPGLKFSFAGGYEDTRIDNGQSAIDLMDRTDAANHPGWLVVKPFPTEPSNCILPVYVIQALLEEDRSVLQTGSGFACGMAYTQHLDPATLYAYQANPNGTGGIGYNGCLNGESCTFQIPAGYPGFDPTQPAINNGEGFAKNLGGNQLPNAPHFTTSLTAEYTLPVSEDWAATLHSDFYWQGNSFARVFNDKPYDQIHGYSNLNLAVILNSADGWQVMGYLKNAFNKTAITGDFLNSDDSGLTTNVFLTDPRLFGVRITKDFGAGGEGGYGVPEFFTDLFSHTDGTRPTLWIELGGQAEHIIGQGHTFAPAFLAANPTSTVLWGGASPLEAQNPPQFSFGEEAKVSFQPEDSDWIVSGAIRFGRSSNFRHVHHQTYDTFFVGYKYGVAPPNENPRGIDRFADTKVHHSESHAVLDFTVGKDVGLGMFGLDGSSVLSGGVRFAQFTSAADFEMRARPEMQFLNETFPAFHLTLHLPYFHTYHASGQAKRGFQGVGPSLSWNGSVPVVGDLKEGEATFDWGANGALLFGRQRTRAQHHQSGHYVTPFWVFRGGYQTAPPTAGGHLTNRSIIVPNLGGFAGVSYRVENAKISLGYRGDFFFGAIDGGIDKRKSQTLGFMGPFATISFGLGG